jgi:hypothetical protein
MSRRRRKHWQEIEQLSSGFHLLAPRHEASPSPFSLLFLSPYTLSLRSFSRIASLIVNYLFSVSSIVRAASSVPYIWPSWRGPLRLQIERELLDYGERLHWSEWIDLNSLFRKTMGSSRIFWQKRPCKEDPLPGHICILDQLKEHF